MDSSGAVFVDRDDTLMVDVGYCNDPHLVTLLPRVAEGLRLLRVGGYRVIVVTNQSGIGRGYFDVATLQKIHEKLRSELRKDGADFDAIYFCPHTPEDGCDCRKPKPGLLLRAAMEMSIDLKASYTIGDRDLDVEAGRAAGTRTVLVAQPAKILSGSEDNADLHARDLAEAADLILSESKDQVARARRSSQRHSSES